MIVPTEGRIVWFRVDPLQGIPHRADKPNAAIVVAVNEDETINLTVFGSDGSHHARENVTLVQEGEPAPGQACWMPFQKGQAARVDKEAELKAIRERGVVERPDGKGFDLAPEQDPEKQKLLAETPAPGANVPPSTEGTTEQTQPQNETAPQG